MTSGHQDHNHHNHSWRNLLPAPHESRLVRAWPRILLATLLSIVVTYVERNPKLQTYSLTPVPFTIMGVAISFFLGFRNTTAYNRFWEARTLWGRIINTTRSLARQVLTQSAPHATAAAVVGQHSRDEESVSRHMETAVPTLEPETQELRGWREKMVSLVIGYAYAIYHHLRGSDPRPDLSTRLHPQELERLPARGNVPLMLLYRMAQLLQEGRRHGWLATADVLAIENSLTQLTDVQGGCERIKNTPMPVTYTLLSHRIVTVFCCALPFGLVESVKLLTPCVVFLVSYAFIGLDVLGEEISDPFGHDPHDLPLPSYASTIEQNLKQMLEKVS